MQARERPTLTTGEVIARLSEVPAEMPIAAVYDCGTAEGRIVKVAVEPDADNDDQPHVILNIE